MFSFSKVTPIAGLQHCTVPGSPPCSGQMERDLVSMVSILPCLQAAIILLKFSRFLTLVPKVFVRKDAGNSQSGFLRSSVCRLWALASC